MNLYFLVNQATISLLKSFIKIQPNLICRVCKLWQKGFIDGFAPHRLTSFRRYTARQNVATIRSSSNSTSSIRARTSPRRSTAERWTSPLIFFNRQVGACLIRIRIGLVLDPSRTARFMVLQQFMAFTLNNLLSFSSFLFDD